MEMNEELRKDAEKGRKARIAEEFFREFLDERRERIVRTMECDTFITTEFPSLTDALAELRVMAKYRKYCEYLKQRGEIAEEALRNGE